MSDLVGRLRALAQFQTMTNEMNREQALAWQAAAEISSLTAEVERLRDQSGFDRDQLRILQSVIDEDQIRIKRLQAVVDAARELLEQTYIAEGFCMPYPSQQKLHDAFRAMDGEL